jgi:uncharacterized protein YbjT (DUF2867 family)
MQNGKILVVGATGRVGGAAVERFLETGFEVRVLVRRPEKGTRLRALGAELVVGDATAPDTLGSAVRDAPVYSQSWLPDRVVEPQRTSSTGVT